MWGDKSPTNTTFIVRKKGAGGSRVLKVSFGINGFSYEKFFYKKGSLLTLFQRISNLKWVRV